MRFRETNGHSNFKIYSKIETQKKPEPKCLQKSPVLAFPLSLHSGATIPHAVPDPDEDRPGENEGEEEGEIRDQSPGTPPPHFLDIPTLDGGRDGHKSILSALDFKILEKLKLLSLWDC